MKTKSGRAGLGALLMIVFLLGCAAPPPPPPVAPPQKTAQDDFNEGLAYFKTGDYDSALHEFSEAVQKNPNFLEAVYYLALTYERKGMYPEAERFYQECIAIDNRYLPARESLGLLYYGQQRYLQAKEQLEIAKNLNSIVPEVYYCLGEIYRMEGNCPFALAAFERALQLNSSYLLASDALRSTRKECAKSSGQKRAKRPVKIEKTFTGGGAAIDPDDF